MRDVGIALAGVVVGAVLNHVLGWRVDRRRNQQRARGIARLLYRDVFEATIRVHAGLAQKKWPITDDDLLPVGPGPALPIENWKRLGADFTAAVADEDDWQSVCLAFESIENENHLIAQGDAFDENRLRRVEERDLMEALHVLDTMRTPLRRRIGRGFSKIRRGGSEFWIPRRSKRDARG